jgi:putative phage-type endonuclease
MNKALQELIASGGDPRNVAQGTDEWKAIRLGHVTASCISDVMGKGVGRHKYMVRLLAERLIGEAGESFTNAAMQWGVDQEQFAAIAYEAKTNVLTDKTGFWLHPDIPWVGVSPDRLVGDDGLVEIKCPNTTTHLDYLFDAKVPAEYVKQIQMQLWVTRRAWCDFVSFDPRLPPRNQLLIVRVERDHKLIAQMQDEVSKFLTELDDLINQLKR